MISFTKFVSFILVAIAANTALGAEIKIISENRLLSEKDVGKVFVAEGITSHPNFGKYKVLLSTQSPGLYAFETFDIENGEPIGKFIVSHPAERIYREVRVDPLTMTKAKIEIKKSNERLRNLLMPQKSNNPN
ncbi:hypothetical protein Q9Q94_10420 [Uliginosibacterium sp. 31-16]|uniref:hypothetical protein n=1 Tax=Uliginosibacterium sp. 31-16 TaxID=3068315 RepID=UPI00273DDE19|nr:hypothetical protein [Uliginosibacterium sp. 31-16]MDP5239950.1 hypothetical protein [Uliginosibacterium sp. 31-16]